MNTSCDSDSMQPFAMQIVRNSGSNEPLSQLISSVGAEKVDILLEMEQEARKFICTHKLEALLQWVAQVTDRSEEQFKPASKRAEALAIAIDRAIDLAHAHARDADRFLARECADNLIQAHAHACDIVRKLEHTECAAETAEGQSSELCPTFTDRVVENWYSGLFDSKLVDLSKPETQALRDYLSANELLIRFKESVVGLSDDSWQTVERQMLLF
jgi:protein-tyrosine-phosphatase